MANFIRQCCGTDVSKDTLDAALIALDEFFSETVIASARFENTLKGIQDLMRWIRKHRLKNLPLQVLMEATGVYHEKATYTLHDKGFEVAVVLPSKIKNYCLSTNIRTVNDKISARQIAGFGLRKKIDNWKKPSEEVRRLKGLCRERKQLIEERTAAKNRQHAKDSSEGADSASKKRAAALVDFLNGQINEIEKQIRALVKEYPYIKGQLNYMISVKGVGLITAATVFAETDGFSLIQNSRQLVCYAGLDVVHKESGTSVKKKGKISHKGNKYIRAALYFPAITAVNNGTRFTEFYNRLFERQQITMKSYVAVQRKMLILMYILWKNKENYNPEKHKSIKNLGQPPTAALTELDHVRS